MIFVDTSFFFTLASTKDPDHERVRAVFEEFDPEQLFEQVPAAKRRSARAASFIATSASR